jgi:hypothetical protein
MTTAQSKEKVSVHEVVTLRSSLPDVHREAQRQTRFSWVVGLAVVVVVVLLAAPLARAGGDFVDLAVGNTRVWFVGEPGVRELDAHRTHHRQPAAGRCALPAQRHTCRRRRLGRKRRERLRLGNAQPASISARTECGCSGANRTAPSNTSPPVPATSGR